MKKISHKILGAILIAAFLLPQSVSALTATQIDSILGLLRAFEAQESVVNNVSATLRGEASSSSSNVVYVDTLELSRTLSRGMKGGDIERLQRFLQRTGDYTDTITGYYGVRTEEAVKSWQARNGIVSSGSPNTTGYGAVGPSTRVALTRAAQVAQSTESFPDPIEEVEGSVGVAETRSQTTQLPPIQVGSTTTPQIPNEGPGVERGVLPPEIPDERPGVEYVRPITISITSTQSPVFELETFVLRWKATNADTCTGQFIRGGWENGPALQGTVFEASARVSQTTEIKLTCRNQGFTESVSLTIPVKFRYPSEIQIGAIVDLLKSFGAAQNTITNVDSILRGGNPSGPFAPSNLSSPQQTAIKDLLKSFNVSPSVIERVEMVLESNAVGLTSAQVKQFMDLLSSFGANLHTIRDAEYLLETGDVTPFGPSNLTKAQQTALMDLLTQFGASATLIEKMRAVLSSESKEKPQLLIDGYNVSSPQMVEDTTLGPLLYFSGQMTSSDSASSIYLAKDCPNDRGACTNIQKVMDAQKLGFTYLSSPSIVRKTDRNGRAYYLMYVEGVEQGKTSSIYFSTSWVGDGVNWSVPRPLFDESHKYPSAVIEVNTANNVLLFAIKTQVEGNVVSEVPVMYRMGESGIVPSKPIALDLPYKGALWGISVGDNCQKECAYVMYASERGKIIKAYYVYSHQLDTTAWKYWGSGVALRPTTGEEHLKTSTHWLYGSIGSIDGGFPLIYAAASNAQPNNFKIYGATIDQIRVRTSMLQNVFDTIANSIVGNGIANVISIFR